MLLFTAAAIALAAFFACSRESATESSAPDASIAEESSEEALTKSFGSYEEAKEAIYELRDTRFENGAYDRAAVASFEDACSDAVMYLRHNREDEDYLQKCYELYEKTLVARDAVDYLRGDEMRVYINVNGTVGEDRYSKCTVSFVDKEGGGIPSCKDTSALIRVRGNSTAGADKKPYNIKLSADMRVLGMESGSKWALLANHFDKTLIRNELAFYLASAAGGYAAPDSRFAEVYLNGKLIGSYLVCEPVTDGKHRADIDTGAGDFIAERVKAWAPGVQDTVTTRELGLRFDIEYAADIKKAKSVLNAAEQAILSGDEDRIRECIDVDSFVAMYVVHELLKDCDLTYGSTYLCCKNGVLFFGPVWDMDLSAGNVSAIHAEEKYYIYNNVYPFGDGSGDSALGVWARQEWLEKLYNAPFFAERVKEKYASLTPVIEDLYAEGGYIDTLVALHGASFERNYSEAGWDISAHASPYESRTVYRSHAQATEELKDWLRRRHGFLKKEFE